MSSSESTRNTMLLNYAVSFFNQNFASKTVSKWIVLRNLKFLHLNSRYTTFDIVHYTRNKNHIQL